MNIFVIDSAGVVGHAVALYFQQQGHQVTGYSEKPFDLVNTVSGSLMDAERIGREVQQGDYDAVIYCAAIVNEAAEADKAGALFINAYLPHFLEKLTEGTKTVVVHRSTDCIFSGEKGGYTLQDLPDAKSFYARTKVLGELVNQKDITIRTSLVGPDYNKSGSSLFNWFYNQQGEVNGFANAIWTGLTTIEFARQIEHLLQIKAHGLFQLVPDSAISKYELLRLFEKYFPGNRKINRVESRQVDKSLLPENNGCDVTVPGYEAMVKDMAQWIVDHKTLYTNYESTY